MIVALAGWAVNRRLYPVPYDVKRLGMVGILTIAGLAGLRVATDLPSLVSFGVRMVVLVAFPALLWLTGLVKPSERQWIKTTISRFTTR